MISSILNSALNLLHLSSNNVYNSAKELSNFENLDTDAVVNNILNLKDAENQAKIGVKLAKVDQELNDTILDILA